MDVSRYEVNRQVRMVLNRYDIDLIDTSEDIADVFKDIQEKPKQEDR